MIENRRREIAICSNRTLEERDARSNRAIIMVLEYKVALLMSISTYSYTGADYLS